MSHTLHLSVSALLLQSAMSPAAFAAPEITRGTVFTNVADGYPVFRIPAVVRANDGTLLAFCEGRAGTSDGGNIDLVLKRSTDNGVTWGPLILVQDEGGTAAITIGNPAPVVDRRTGHIHLLFCRENDTVFHTVSTDKGLTWAPRREITSGLKRAGWGWYATGPVHGIQLKHGNQAGRLVVPANHRIGAAGSDSGPFGSQILYSDDQGATWHMDAVFEEADGASPNETTLEELTPASPGGGSRVYINSRDYGSDAGNRSEAWSADGGTTYSVPYNGNPFFVTPVCQGSLLRYSSTADGDSRNRLLFSSPNGGSRSNGALWISNDDAGMWSQPKSIHTGAYAYSDMVRTTDNHLGILFETGASVNQYQSIDFIRANEAWLDAPPTPAENPGASFWNLEEVAPGGTSSTAANAILDIHPAQNHRHLTAQSALPVIGGAATYGGSRALSFSGTGGLQVSDADSSNGFDFSASDSFTVEIVCRMPAGSTQTAGLVAKDLASKSPSWWLRVEAGKARFLVSDNATECFLSSTASINDGQWHHIAAVRDARNPAAKKLRILVDGQLSGEIADTTTSSLANSQSLWIGRFNASGRHFTGDIDCVRIMPAALSPVDFINSRTQFDADSDKIPDDFERKKTSSLAPFGGGDVDGDGAPDLLEFALGGDPSSPDRLMHNITRGTDFVEVHSRQRALPAWLDIVLSSSGDLVAWSDSNSVVTLSALNDEVFERVDRMNFPLGVPQRLFVRHQLVELP